jgi:ABC-2 type transport system ATP-binding protein
VAGYRTDKDAEALHEVIGLLTETPGFYDRLSAHRNLEFYAGLYAKVNVRAQIEKYLKLMGLWNRRTDLVGAYSKGMKQRLALTRALLHNPKVLFLDEPTAGLDPEAAHEVMSIIKNLSEEGRTIFLCTHNLAEAEELADRIAIFQTRLLALDTSTNLRERLFHRQTIVKLETAPGNIVSAIALLPFVKEVKASDNQLIIELTEPEKNLPDLVKNIVDMGGKVLGVSEEQHSLEEIYLTMVHEEKNEPQKN